MAKEDNKKNNNIKSTIIWVIRTICIICFFVAATYIVTWGISSIENRSVVDKVKENVNIYSEKDNITNNEIYEFPKYMIDFEGLLEKNTDTVAWIKVKGTDVENVIVKGNNNSYYLNHNFEKKYNVAGWLFADYKNKFDGTDKNIIIYGHNMLDGSMFGSLTNILKKEWYNNESNYIIDFLTESTRDRYQVFSVYKIEPEDYYIETEFKKTEFEKFVKTIKNRSIKDFGVEVTGGDQILTLSTCDNTYTKRIVLHAKKIVEWNS